MKQARSYSQRFRPMEEKIAFVRDNNLYIKDLVTLKEITVTKDGAVNKIKWLGRLGIRRRI
ncbi:MAG: DPP IV N-terminal domain-containing protein [Sphingobacteriaceae bacterium]|nr:DPP IV N-terminal domain-containing protein [Sphingobacteriaceae bacterium]